MSETHTYEEEEGFLEAEEDLGAEVVAEPEVTDRDRALARGWRPREEYRAPPNNPNKPWIDYPEFLARGDRSADMMKEQLDRLSQRYATLDSQTKQKIAGLEQAVHDAVNMAKNASEAGYKRGLAELRAKQRQAASEADTDTFDTVTAQIDAMEAERVTAPAPAPRNGAAPPERQTRDPAYDDLLIEYPWAESDPVLTPQLVAIHNGILVAHPAMSIKASLDMAMRRLKAANPERFGEQQRNAPPPAAEEEELATADDEFEAAPAPRQRQPLVRRPTGGGGTPPPSRGAAGWNRIADPAARAEAQRAFRSIQNAQPDLTVDQYLRYHPDAIGGDPHGDVIGDIRRDQRRQRAT